MPFLQQDYGIRSSQADTAAPTSGSYQVFDFIWNSAPSASTPMGWVCTASGSPGTWLAVAPAQNVGNTATLAVAGAVAADANILTLTGTTYNVTLAAPAAANNGTVLNIVNTASGTVTAVAASGAAIVGLATMATATSATFKSLTTNWYRVT